jgi:hypothetical protein
MFNEETGVGILGIGKVFYADSLLSYFKIPFEKGLPVENRIIFSYRFAVTKKAARMDSL